MKKFKMPIFFYILALLTLLTILLLREANVYYTESFIDFDLSFFGLTQIIFFLFASVNLILMVILLRFVKSREGTSFVNKVIFIPIIVLIFAFIPVTRVFESYYLNNNIFAAIKFKDDRIESVKHLVNINTVNMKNLEGKSPLAVAIINDKYNIADYLVKNGASLDISEELKSKNEDTGEVVMDFGQCEDAKRFFGKYKVLQ
jgi:hypothetical protein